MLTATLPACLSVLLSVCLYVCLCMCLSQGRDQNVSLGATNEEPKIEAELSKAENGGERAASPLPTS